MCVGMYTSTVRRAMKGGVRVAHARVWKSRWLLPTNFSAGILLHAKHQLVTNGSVVLTPAGLSP